MDERFLQLYVPVQQTIVSYWMGTLPTTQTVLLLFICERTLRYGKEKESIPKRHFLKGVVAANGTRLHAGVNIAHTALWKNLIELEQKRALIRVEKSKFVHVGNKYSLHLTNLMGPTMTDKLKTSSKNYGNGRQQRRLKVSKKASEAADSEGELVRLTNHSSTPSVLPTSTLNVLLNNRYINNRFKSTERLRVAKAPRSSAVEKQEVDSILARTEATKAKVRKVRAARAAAANTNLKTPNVKAAWDSALQSAREQGCELEVNPPTEKLCGIFRGHMNRLYPAKGYDLTDLFFQIFTNWRHIRYEQLSWYDKLPKYPHFDFVAYQMPLLKRALSEITTTGVSSIDSIERKRTPRISYKRVSMNTQRSEDDGW